MYNESTTIVDVVTLGESGYALSMKAEDLWVAFEVVRRHIDADGARHYSQMVEAKITSDGYSFKFDTGDVFTCASHEEYPTSETLSDESSGGGSGGGVLVVGVTISGELENVYTLDKTWQEIYDADYAVCARSEMPDEKVYYQIMSVRLNPFTNKYQVVIYVPGIDNPVNLSANSASGYPSATLE